MKNQKKAAARISNTVIAMALTVMLPAMARADEAPSLIAETALTDTTTVAAQPPCDPVGKTTMLYGQAKKHDVVSGTEGVAEQAKTDSNLFKLATQKLAAGQELTSDEYRSLGAGCAGYESNRTFFQPIAKISAVYRDSPAAKAGLRKGDKIVDVQDDTEAKEDPSRPLFGITCGMAGTPVTITVLRHGNPIKVTMIRMNIEDIQETSARNEWEQTIRKLGYPQSGTFMGPNMNSLHNVPDAAPQS